MALKKQDKKEVVKSKEPKKVWTRSIPYNKWERYAMMYQKL